MSDKPELRSTMQIDTDDGGPVDEEHINVVALLQEGAPPEDVKEMMRNCSRPATLTFLDGRPN